MGKEETDKKSMNGSGAGTASAAAAAAGGGSEGAEAEEETVESASSSGASSIVTEDEVEAAGVVAIGSLPWLDLASSVDMAREENEIKGKDWKRSN